MSFAIWHGRHLNVLFNASLLRMVVFNVSDTMAGLLTAKYDSYSFTTVIDLVFVQLKDLVGVSACDAQAEVVIGLDWISLFRVVILNLYTEPSIDEEVEMVSDLTLSVQNLFACRIVIRCHLFLVIITIICLPIDPSELFQTAQVGRDHA